VTPMGREKRGVGSLFGLVVVLWGIGQAGGNTLLKKPRVYDESCGKGAGRLIVSTKTRRGDVLEFHGEKRGGRTERKG